MGSWSLSRGAHLVRRVQGEYISPTAGAASLGKKTLRVPVLPPIRSLFDAKAIWRERLKALRKDAAAARPDAADHAARIFLEAIDPPHGAVVSLYHPMRTELDTGPLMSALLERKINIVLPVVIAKKRPLQFRRYSPGDPLEKGVYGERIPADEAPEARPDIVVAPLLGFSRAGDRLGYGGGYYDRTLKSLRQSGAVIVVGYAYGAQEVDGLPVSPLDQRLDWIVTERGAINCRRN